MSFQTFVDAWNERALWPATVVDISPHRLKVSSRTSASDVLRGFTIARRLWREIPRHAATVVFASNGFYLRFSGVLAALKRHFSVPLFASTFGGSLYDDIMKLGVRRRGRLIADISTFDGIIVETAYLGRRLSELGFGHLSVIPGYRRIDWEHLPERRESWNDELRVIFLSQVRRDKGIFILLEAVAMLAESGCKITCDVYGPVDPAIEREFFARCAELPVVRYRGVADGHIPELLAGYDLLVLPTFYQGEGHPGVLIEAMVAGIPVVASRFKAIPEVVDDGKNGILVEPQSAEDLARALRELARDRARLRAMGREQRLRLHRHDVAAAVDSFCALIARSGL